jgi:hypothetical protein
MEEQIVKLHSEIHNIINKYVVCDEIEYKTMALEGLTISQCIYITQVIEDGLTLFTNDHEWSKQTAWQIMYGVQGFFKGLILTNQWNHFYLLLSAQDLANIIYKNIEWQLGSHWDHVPCILDNALYFYNSKEDCKR